MFAEIFGVDAIIVLLLLLLFLVLPIWAIVDVAQRPVPSGTKTGWIIGLIVGMFLEPIGIVLALVYLLFARTRLPQN